MGAPKLQPVQRMNEHDFKQFEMVSRMLHGDTMTEEALNRSQDETKEAGVVQFSQYHAWCQLAYVIEAGTKEIDPKKSFGVRTYRSLFYHALNDLAVFWTPNTFCSRTVFKKDNNHMRWINAIVVDIDEIISLEELLKRIQKAKLPPPTTINRTPSGGWHVYWILKKRIKGWYKSNRELYSKIAKAIQVSIGADAFAKSVSNYFRIPKDIQYLQPNNRFTMLKFKNWYKKALETNYLVKETSKESLMDHKAIVELKKGVADGNRNIAAYSLAKVYQYEGYSLKEAFTEMQEWNKLNIPALSDRELTKRVNSAFNGDSKIPLNYIHDITGIKLNIGRIVAFRNHAKERSERKKSHFEEIINDLFFYLNKYGSFFGSQRELREELEATTGFEVKERSLKEVIKQLKTDAYQDKIKIEILGRGRGSRTKITLISDNKDNNKQSDNVVHFVPQMYPKNILNGEHGSNQFIMYPKCTPNGVQQLSFGGVIGKICTPIGVQKAKNFKQKTKKLRNEVYSSNKVMSMHRALSGGEERMVQTPNKHNERMVGMASQMAGRPPLECGYQYFHEVHSENVMAVDAVDPCGNVDNRRRLVDKKLRVNREGDD